MKIDIVFHPLRPWFFLLFFPVKLSLNYSSATPGANFSFFFVFFAKNFKSDGKNLYLQWKDGINFFSKKTMMRNRMAGTGDFEVLNCLKNYLKANISNRFSRGSH